MTRALAVQKVRKGLAVISDKAGLSLVVYRKKLQDSKKRQQTKKRRKRRNKARKNNQPRAQRVLVITDAATLKQLRAAERKRLPAPKRAGGGNTN